MHVISSDSCTLPDVLIQFGPKWGVALTHLRPIDAAHAYHCRT